MLADVNASEKRKHFKPAKISQPSRDYCETRTNSAPTSAPNWESRLPAANQSSMRSGHTNSSQHHRLSYEGRVRSARTFPEAADDGERRGGGGRGRWRGRRRRAVALRRGRLRRRGVHRTSGGSGHLDLAGSGGSATTRGRGGSGTCMLLICFAKWV
jgi:hypothetical protein